MFTALRGRVDQTDANAVATRFFALGVPLFPRQTVYVLADGTEVPLRLSVSSIALGYLRVWSAVAVVALAWLHHLMPAFAALAFCFVAVLLPAAWQKRRVEQRRIFRRLAGMAVEPASLEVWNREDALKTLLGDLAKHNLPTSPEALAALVASMGQDRLELVWAVAELGAIFDEVWVPIARDAWARRAQLLEPMSAAEAQLAKTG